VVDRVRGPFQPPWQGGTGKKSDGHVGSGSKFKSCGKSSGVRGRVLPNGAGKLHAEKSNLGGEVGEEGGWRGFSWLDM
jgi:hypothetical protein